MNAMEKRPFVMIAAIMMTAASVNAQEGRTVDAYFTADEMPDMRLFMPGPPDSTSVAFANDVSRYFWGKEMRMDPERAEQVKRDAVYGLATIIEEFEEAFGMKISQEQTPEIYKVLLLATAVAAIATIIVLTVRIDACTNVKITVVNIFPIPLKNPCTALVSAGHR